ncbi:hypothetical protein [Nostoc sp. MG11]|nr:hypothetical protein [Nostoc sp. MG11]
MLLKSATVLSCGGLRDLQASELSEARIGVTIGIEKPSSTIDDA